MTTTEDNKVQIISEILESEIKESELPSFYYAYMAGMIIEESLESQLDLHELLFPFIMNGHKFTEEQAKKLTKNIYDKLIDAKILSKIRQGYQFVSEKLSQPVTLNEVNILGKQDAHSGYVDAFLGIEKMEIQGEELEVGKCVQKKQDKEAKKLQTLYEKHICEMESLKQKMPPATIQRGIYGNRELQVDNITLMVGGKTLLSDSSLRLASGRKYGLIGRNGVGKTSLLAALARREFEKMNPGVQLLLVEQEVPGDNRTVLQTVLDADVEREDLLRKEKDLMKRSAIDDKANVELLEVYKRLEEIGAFQAESKAAAILGGLGFTQEMQHKETLLLSGGWRMRVSLSRALFINPDILLLDEPTNHLDLDAVMWLEDYLTTCKNTVIVVSHAREFLNIVCQEIIHFFDYKLTYYSGNYDQFEKTREEKMIQSSKSQEAKKLHVQHMQAFIDKFRYNAKRASLVQSRIKALAKMPLIEEIVQDPTCVFQFPQPEKMRPPLLRLEEGVFGYDDRKVILKNVNFHIDMESRIAIVGANGVGKSTFLKLLDGQLMLLEGQHYKNSRLRVSLFTQHQVDQLDMKESPLEHMATTYPNRSTESYRGHLSSFGITQFLQLRPMYLLSGGQKSRVALASCLFKNPQILILDEPTNHLDIDAVNALIIALNNYQGGVLIVSHDQHLIASVCDHIYYIKDFRLRKFNGDFEDYRKALASGRL